MADRFAALAGFQGDETGTDYNTTRGNRTEGVGLDSDDGLSMAAIAPQKPAAAPLAQRKSNVPEPAPTTSKGSARNPATDDRPATPRAQTTTAGRRADPPSTAHKADPRRLQGIRIADDDPSNDALGDSLDDSEAELQRVRDDMSRANETTLGESVEVAEDSGLMGRRARMQRTAAGISLKDSEAKIKRLEAENNDFKIEVDILRRNWKDDERAMELVTLKQAEFKKMQRIVLLESMVKRQDTALSEARKKMRAMEKEQRKAQPDVDVAQLEAALRAERDRADEERRLRLKAEEEVEFLRARYEESKRREGDISDVEAQNEVRRLTEELETQKLDHQDIVWELRRERDELLQDVEELRAGGDLSRVKRSRDETAESIVSERQAQRLKRETQELQESLAATKSENEELAARLDQLEDEKARLSTDLEECRYDLHQAHSAEDALQRELEVANQRLEHMAEESGELGERMERSRIVEVETLKEQQRRTIDALRDELSAAQVAIQEKEEKLDQLEQAVGELEEDLAEVQHDRNVLEGKLQAAEEANEALHQEADEIEAEAQEFKAKAEELAALAEELQDKLDAKEQDLVETNREVQNLSDQCLALEEEAEKLKTELAAADEDINNMEASAADEKAHAERHMAALKERLASAEEMLSQAEAARETLQQDYSFQTEEATRLRRLADQLRQECDDLAADKERRDVKIEELMEDLKAEEYDHEREVADLQAELEDEKARSEKLLEQKDEQAETLAADLASAREQVAQGKQDLERLQNAIRDKENESMRMGQSHSNDKYSLELEIDRLKRDLTRCEADLERTRKDLERKEDALRAKEDQISNLHTEARELTSKLAAESSGKTGLQDKIDGQERARAALADELEKARAKAEELDRQLSQGERSMMHVEQQTRDQLTERNTLLLTIYQYMEKILGERNTPRKRGEGEPRPFTNFGLFHDSLIARLRRISEIQQQFASRAKGVEDRFAEQFTALKRQQDSRFRQIDRFEMAIKNATDKQTQWRARVVSKQAELDAVKATNTELQQQLSSLKTRSSLASPGDATRISSLTARANNAERRLQAAQTAAQQAEERLTEAKSKYGAGEGKWAARIKELEARVKAAEERVRAERQGAKSRVAELTEQMRRLEKEVEAAQKRKRAVEGIKDAVDNID